jgi:hypothetical protein
MLATTLQGLGFGAWGLGFEVWGLGQSRCRKVTT